MASMATRLASQLAKRQDDGNTPFNSTADDYNYYDDGGWWWSTTGMAVRYSIITLIFVVILLYFVGGYLHATRRIRKGLPPKAYHAWMVRRYYNQPQQNPYYQHPPPPPQGAYNMPTYTQPPPAYNPYTAPPPAYQPPEGASKAMADQNFSSARTYRAADYAEGSQSASGPASNERQ